MHTLLKDFRLAVRTLTKKPGFTAIAVLTLALGIAVNATIFSLVSAFLLRKPPGQDPSHIVVISAINPGQVFQPDVNPVSAANYLTWRAANDVFTDLAAADEYRTVNVTEQVEPESVRAAAISPNYFNVFAVAPALGRAFVAGEDRRGRDHVVILSHQLWTRRFGSDPNIINRTVRLNREDYVVVGVMPASFRLLGFTPQLWLPLVLDPSDQTEAARKDRSLYLFARLKPGITAENAHEEFATLARRAEQDFPAVEKGWGATVRTLPDFLIHNFNIRAALAVMMTTVGFVLLIACANVAGLLLARAAGRRKELGIRIALGAGRFSIIQQLLVEGLVIAVLGGALGVLFSYWGINFVAASMSFNDDISAVPVRLDTNVVLFALGVSLASALLCGLAPALKASRTDVNTSLKEESRASSASRSHHRLRTVLVTAEIALALFLLIGTGLLAKGLMRIQHQDLGFQPQNLLTAGITLDDARYKDPSKQTAFVVDAVRQLRQIPGARVVAITSQLPATGPSTVSLQLQGQPELPTGQRPTALDFVVSPDYLRAAAIPLLRGRSFAETDNVSASPVVLVNEQFVRLHLRDQDPLGKQIRIDVAGATNPWRQIVGVVGNVKSYSESTRDEPEVYEPYLQRPVSSFSIILRTDLEPGALASALRSAVSGLDPDLPVAHVMTMPTLLDRQNGGDKFFGRILGSFAVLALVLSAIGIYGLIGYSVSQRTHEIGIRMALGAEKSSVLRLVLTQGLQMAVIGGSIGFVMALPLPKLFAAIFYDLQIHEPILYLMIPAAILAVAMFATYVPARRAARVDPMVALRHE